MKNAMSTDDSNALQSARRKPRFPGAGLDAIMSPPEEVPPASAVRSPTEFTLVYELPDGDSLDFVARRLCAAGLADALVDVGEVGRIALHFECRDVRLLPAVADAIARVTLAHPWLLMRSIR